MFMQVIEGRLKDERNWQVLQAMDKDWDEKEASRAPGYIKAELYRDAKDPRHIVQLVWFESPEKAAENSKRPETNAFYQRVLAITEGEPRFIDCVDSP